MYTCKAIKKAYSFECDVSQSHFRAVKMEEVHQLNCSAFLQSPIINSTRLVVQLNINREDLDVFCISVQLLVRDKRSRISSRKKISFSGGGEGSEPAALKAKNFFRKSRASWST